MCSMRESTTEKLIKFRQNRTNIIKDVYESKEEVARLLFFSTYNRKNDVCSVLDIDKFINYMKLTRTNGYNTIVEDMKHFNDSAITWDLILNRSRLSDRYIYGVISSYLFENTDELNKLEESTKTYIAESKNFNVNIDVEISNSAIEFIKFWKMDPVIKHEYA